jgi:SAM-dependent methyltransferase
MTCSTDYNANIKDFYNSYPYPKRAVDDIRHSAILPADIFAIDRYILQNQLSGYASLSILVAGSGTGDAAVALINQSRRLNINIELHCLDISEKSLEILRQRVNKVDPKINVKIYCESIEAFCRSCNIQFDYIDLCGVINHVEDQVEVLSKLCNILSASGGIGIMAYGEYGRYGVYPLQRAFQSIRQYHDIQIDDVRLILKSLKSNHPLLRNELFANLDKSSDEEIADIFLNPRDKSFTVADLKYIAKLAGLHISAFIPGFIYDPSLILGVDATSILEKMPEELRPELSESFLGTIRKHCFFVTKNKHDAGDIDLTAPNLRFRFRDLNNIDTTVESMDEKWLYLTIQYERTRRNIKIALPGHHTEKIKQILRGDIIAEVLSTMSPQLENDRDLVVFLNKLEATGLGFISSV